jgi:hypothetical protein
MVASLDRRAGEKQAGTEACRDLSRARTLVSWRCVRGGVFVPGEVIPRGKDLIWDRARRDVAPAPSRTRPRRAR